jgi:hypothetical protein
MVYQNNGIDNPVTGAYEEGQDSLKNQEHKQFSNDRYYARLVEEASMYYDNMSELRKKWTRANNYFMGRQLDDKVIYNGQEITVKELLDIRGLPAFQNDIISDKVLTLKGILRQENMAATCKATDANEDMYAAIFSEFLRTNDNLNHRQELNAEFFQEFCIYGFLCGKVSRAYREGRDDIYIDKVDIYNIAVPPFEKSDLSDVNFIAEAHDMSWPELLENFCQDKNGNASDKAEQALKDIYARQTDTEQTFRNTGFNHAKEEDDFYHSNVIGKYRVIEIWKKERNRALWCHDYASADVGFRPLSDKNYIDQENKQRIADNIVKDEMGQPILDANGEMQFYIDPNELQLIEYKIKIEQFWYYRFLSPNGYLLSEGVSPYKVTRDGYGFRFHPYVFLAPNVKGETRSFIDRVIDKQRATNHYNLMLDSILANAAKGAIAYDVASEVPEQSREERIYNYNKPNGVVLYNSQKGEKPSALQSVSIPAGLDWLISKNESTVVSQSGVQGALQGVHQNTSGTQYRMEKESASTTVADYFGSFYSFCLRISKIQLWEMQEFYDSHKSIKLTGDDSLQYYNPDTMMDVNFDLQLDMDPNSTVMREANNDMLWQLMLQNKIDIMSMLDCGSWSNTARLKKRIEEYQAQQQAQQQMQATQMGGQPQQSTQPAIGQQKADDKQNQNIQQNPTVGSSSTSA